MSSIVHKEERIGHLWSKKNEVSRYISYLLCAKWLSRKQQTHYFLRFRTIEDLVFARMLTIAYRQNIYFQQPDCQSVRNHCYQNLRSQGDPMLVSNLK